MAHFAQVQNGRVTSVIVADPEFAVTADETWIRTSYNTYGGVHYGPDGLPDGLYALRKNFANVGDIYDSQRDAFYKPNTLAYHYLDEDSCLWKPVMPNRAVEYIAELVATPRTKVYIPNYAQQRLGPLALRNLTDSLKLEIVSNPVDAQIALPFSDQEAQSIIERYDCAHLAPMSKAALTAITDRVGMQSLGIPVLPTYLPKTLDELLALPNEPIFVKRRSTYTNDTTPWAYKEYANPQALSEAVTAEFWEIQNSTNTSVIQFILQPALIHPMNGLSLNIAVNAQSEVLLWSALSMVHISPKRLGNTVPYEDDTTALVASIQAVCQQLGIVSGISELQFVQYQGEWCLLDWNARLTGAYAQCYPMAYPVLDDAILHMLGLPLRGKAAHLYVEYRSYRHLNLPKSYALRAMRCGLFPRFDYDAPDILARVSAIGENKKEVQDKYILFENMIS